MDDTVLIRVLAVNDPPVIHDLPDTSFSSDTTMTLDLNKYVEDIDHPKSALTWRADVQPPYDDSLLVAIDNTTKIATFSAIVIFTARAEVMFTVTDDSSASDQKTIAVQWHAKNQASGIYFISIEAGCFSQIRKMVLVR